MSHVDSRDVSAIMDVLEQTSVSDDAYAILTSTDPVVHAALLNALIRAEVLTGEYEGDHRRYVTTWQPF